MNAVTMPSAAALRNCGPVNLPPRRNCPNENNESQSVAPITRSHADGAGANSAKSRTAITAPTYWLIPETMNSASGGAV